MTSLTSRAARWSARHRKLSIGGWLAFVVAAVMLGSSAGFVEKGADDGVGSSGRADRAVARAFPEKPSEQVLVEGPKTVAADVLQRVRAAHGVESASVDRRNGDATLIAVQLARKRDAVALVKTTEKAQKAHPDAYVGQFGEASIETAIDDEMGADMGRAESLSLPITLVLLLVTFGSVVAALVPLGLAMSAVMAALGIVSLLSHAVVMDAAVNNVVLLIGLAVGVDYSLFYLRREREERASGGSRDAALAAAAATSGHAVLVSGITVMIAMAGMFLAGSSIFTALAIGSMIVVAVTLLASVSVLPAVLVGLKGSKRIRRESRVWAVILDRVLRRPALSAAAAAAVLIALAIPALSMHTALPTTASVPDDIAGKQAYNRIERAFPGDSMPATVVVRNPSAGELPANAELSRDGSVARYDLPLQEGDAAALRSLRAAVRDRYGDRADVTGMAAGSADFDQLMSDRAPLVFAFVLGLAFVLLLATFRSVVIPIKAIVLNLLSVGAAYGVLSLWFDEPITAWLPMFLFVILFGLSMDYHVFIVSRIRELRMAGRTTRDAVSEGIRSTAGVVTSAAAIMVAVFGAFGLVRSLEMQQMGIGLAAAVLIDATLIRAVLLAAAMALLGEWNWWWPGRGSRRVAAPRAAASHASA